MAEQVFLGGPTQFEGPKVIQAHLRRTRLPGVSPKQVMHLQTHKQVENTFIINSLVCFRYVHNINLPVGVCSMNKTHLLLFVEFSF